MIKLKELPKFFTLSRVESETDMVNEQQPPLRSEEHTSELQSRLHLVCRLLLEKKKKEKTSQIEIQAHQVTLHTLCVLTVILRHETCSNGSQVWSHRVSVSPYHLVEVITTVLVL